MAVSYNYAGPRIVDDGLVLYLDAANPNSYNLSTPLTWRDISGNRNNGTLVNGTVVVSTTAGNVMSFDGVDDYVNLGPNIGSFSSPNFTFGAWFYFNNINQTSTIIGKRNDNPYNQWNMAIANDAQNGGNGKKFTVFVAPDGGGAYTTINYDLAPFGSRWYYGVTTITNTQQIAYLNAQNVGSNINNYSGKTFIIPNKNTYIGALNVNSVPTNFYKSSYIAFVHLYNRALSPDEVLQNYNATKGRFGL